MVAAIDLLRSPSYLADWLIIPSFYAAFDGVLVKPCQLSLQGLTVTLGALFGLVDEYDQATGSKLKIEPQPRTRNIFFRLNTECEKAKKDEPTIELGL